MGVGITASDSQNRFGGVIPGAPGRDAFTLTGPKLSVIPVLIAVPHAGRIYPDAVLRDMRDPHMAALRLEDRLVDRIGHAIADQTGATLLVANAPRAMIDLNRAPDDVDWGMFMGEGKPHSADYVPTKRARSGLGIIPRRVPGMGELWKRSFAAEELAERISGIHEPYHVAVAEALAELRARWGAAVLLDLHSMPTIRPRGAALPPEFVLGDRFGAACHGSLSATVFSFLHRHDRVVAHNRPYSGGYVLERHASPKAGIHALQLEIDRATYLDRDGASLGAGMGRLVSLLVDLVRAMAAQATILADMSSAQGWSEAAE
jgi:N-formylglutamate amidohydrolase